MALTKAQQGIWQRASSLGAGAQGVRLTEEDCAYLVGVVAHDLGIRAQFPEIPRRVPHLFSRQPISKLRLPGLNAKHLFERLVEARPDADTYFACLATLHKSRLKYESILQTQATPTIEQVGPRGLLQFGRLPPPALVGLLFWRKWFFDIENRAGQETGYLFEPVIAHALGGTPAPAKRSPIRRTGEPDKRRQVDCLLDTRAYEIKIRVTIASSGQGRWREELEFPDDCRASGFTPVLLVLDPTPNSKLAELEARFLRAGGEAYVGDAAWTHMDSLAGPTMARFLSKYVREPLDSLTNAVPQQLPDFRATERDGQIKITVGGSSLKIIRRPDPADEVEDMPDDVDEELPGA